MGLFTKEQLRELIKERGMKTTDDISLLLRDLFGETLQEMMEAEMDTTLGYGKNQKVSNETGNRRNGHSKKTVVSEYGESEIGIPRDRNGEHDPLIVKKHQKNLTGIEEQIFLPLEELHVFIQREMVILVITAVVDHGGIVLPDSARVIEKISDGNWFGIGWQFRKILVNVVLEIKFSLLLQK